MSFNDGDITRLSQQHHWAATGVADYPPRDPLVGQSRFFKRFQTFLHTVDHDDNRFAHVFAVEAEWGRGKSRLGHELVAQINDCSKGWYVRDGQGQLQSQQLFSQANQDQYLALYIRYSQVASDYQNSDNWFAYGLYQALLPLATGKFDGSIQSEIAKQAYERLMPFGFSAAKLAEALQLNANHSEESLYENPTLAVELVQAAYAYLKTFGVHYLLVVLDELETVAEAATYGLEDDDNARLDGQAIRLIGKAIKEEDPRRKLPWLRYVALCSPLLGQQLREIQSVARRFELVELEPNAFADVSDYVASLQQSDKLAFAYPSGLVEAAYAMSGANFGWFNVVMANVDAILSQYQQAGRTLDDVGELFEAVVAGSGRVAKHVLDKGALEGIQTRDQNLLTQCRTLLYGQLPIRLSDVANAQDLLQLKNEDQEPVAALYRHLSLDRLQCRQALEQAKFRRKGDDWLYPAVDQALSLDTLLDNLRTFSIKEQASSQEPNSVLVPLVKGEFKYLLSLLYDHPAIEFAADALWHQLVGEEVGEERDLPASDATHIGPSVAMLLRLDLRYRSAQHNSMIFREPSYSDGHEQAMAQLQQQSARQPQLKLHARVTGFIRLLDNHWRYNEPLLSNKAGPNQSPLVILTEPRGRQGGLMTLNAFKLHPDGKALFAWVSNKEELDKLHDFAATYAQQNGRTPVLALTGSAHLTEQYSRLDEGQTLRDAILLNYVNPSECDQLERIGLDCAQWAEYGFELGRDAFTAKFKNKLKGMEEYAEQGIHKWRRRLSERGLLAWPLKVDGKLSATDRDTLFKGWFLLAIQHPELQGLMDIKPSHGVDAGELGGLLDKLKVPGGYIAKGFSADEHAGLFSELSNPQHSQAHIPLFLARIANPNQQHQWTLEKAKQNWYFAYVAEVSGVTPKTVFDDWMWWCGQLKLLSLENPTERQAKWVSYPLSRLDNAIVEAQNWFSGTGSECYKAKVEVLARVYGHELIHLRFSPLGSKQLGTATVEAKEQLELARKLFDGLKPREEQLPDMTRPEQAADLGELINTRAQILQLVAKVKPVNAPAVRLPDAHILDLEDKATSLYQRVEQACLFADWVERSAQRIRQRVDDLLVDIAEDCRELAHFPKAFYSQNLRTINHILEGALAQDGASETARKEQQAGSNTLLHYLRKLDLGNAQDRLQLLASEVGLNLQTEQQLNLAEINGDILASYRAFKQRFTQLVNNLATHSDTALTLLDQLNSAPADYPAKDDIAALPGIQQKFVLINDALEDIATEAEQKRTQLRPLMQSGQFSGLRDVPEQLLQPVRGQVAPLHGQLLKIEERLNGFKRQQLEQVNAILPSLRPLLTAKGQTVPTELKMEDAAGRNLSELQLLCDQTAKNWSSKAQSILNETGVTLAEWQAIFAAINAGKEPDISSNQRDGLVQAGILKMRLTFVGD